MEKVVIIGGGFGGVETAIRLRKLNKDLNITLINDNDCFTFIPSIYENAACVIPNGDICILLSSVLHNHDIKFYHDKVKKINTKKKTLKTKNLSKINWDYLVLAIGAKTNFHKIKGAKKYSLPLKTNLDAQIINEKIEELLASKDKGNITICGGGLSGVELASTLADQLNKTKFKINIIESNKTILNGMPKKAIEYAVKVLKDKKVKIISNTNILKITSKEIITNKQSQSYNLAIWCGGVENNELIKTSSFSISSKIGFRAKNGGGVFVNEFFQANDNNHIFALGDCITNKDINILKTAQNAVYEASFVATNIHNSINNKPLKKFINRPNKVYCSLGKNKGMSIFNDEVKTGKAIRIEKEELEQKYIKNLKNNKISKNNIYN